MAKQEFVQNVRLARNLLAHRVEGDRPGADLEEIARRLARAAIWLTPASVEGFDMADFPELPDETREELRRNVGEFLAVAEQVSDDGPASVEQEAVGIRTLLNIVRILEPFLPTPDELDRLRAAMRTVRFPPDVVESWDYEFGLDSSGDPAVWIWLVVDDRAADDPAFTATTARLQREILQSLQRAGVSRWPYVRFRTISDYTSRQAVGG
jgi:hypothetical protein